MTGRVIERAAGMLVAVAMMVMSAAAWSADHTVEASLLGVADTQQTAEIQTMRVTWTDERREREVPAKLYLPSDDADGPWPVVIFSHGLGGTRDAGGYLGTHWAQHGYLSVHLQHHGSDDAIWRGKPIGQRLDLMRKATKDGISAMHRPRDVSFALDTLEALNADADSPLFGKLDLQRIAVAGHSYGAWTALAAGGRTIVGKWGGELNLSDDRVKAVISLSGHSDGDPERDARSFATLKLPSMHMTGTLDTTPINDLQPSHRRVPYDMAPGPEQGGADQYLIILNGGDHMVFGGRIRWGRQGDHNDDAMFHELIRQSTTAFLNAYLLDDDQARDWLRSGACEKELGEHASFEMK